MTTMERKLDLLIQYTIAADDETKKQLLEEIAATVEPASDDISVNLDDAIFTLVNEVGISHALLGREYIEYALKLIVSDRNYLRGVSSRLYPDVASEFHTTASCVERSIRHAVEVMCSRCDLDVLTELFGNTINPHSGKLTNSEFLAGCAAVLRKRMRNQT